MEVVSLDRIVSQTQVTDQAYLPYSVHRWYLPRPTAQENTINTTGMRTGCKKTLPQRPQPPHRGPLGWPVLKCSTYLSLGSFMVHTKLWRSQPFALRQTAGWQRTKPRNATSRIRALQRPPDSISSKIADLRHHRTLEPEEPRKLLRLTPLFLDAGT